MVKLEKVRYGSSAESKIWQVQKYWGFVDSCLRRNDIREKLFLKNMAEEVGFEPTVRFLAHTLSKRAP